MSGGGTVEGDRQTQLVEKEVESHPDFSLDHWFGNPLFDGIGEDGDELLVGGRLVPGIDGELSLVGDRWKFYQVTFPVGQDVSLAA